MTLKGINSVLLYKGGGIHLIFELENCGTIDEKSIKTELRALCDIEPMDCPCGCGASLTVMNCLKLTSYDVLTDMEIDFVRSNQKLEAIKAIRLRKGIGLKDAKDLVDAFVNLDVNYGA